MQGVSNSDDTYGRSGNLGDGSHLLGVLVPEVHDAVASDSGEGAEGVEDYAVHGVDEAGDEKSRVLATY